jgi:hypothetical protein
MVKLTRVSAAVGEADPTFHLSRITFHLLPISPFSYVGQGHEGTKDGEVIGGIEIRENCEGLRPGSLFIHAFAADLFGASSAAWDSATNRLRSSAFPVPAMSKAVP